MSVKRKVLAAPVSLAAPATPSEMTFRERRRAGITVFNLGSIVRELKASGEIDENDTNAEIAAAVAVRFQETNSQALANAAIDWDKLIALIERLLPLILKLFGL